MRRLLERSFVVEATPAASWATMIDAQTWPRWARHISRVELTPPGVVDADTSAVLVLTNRTKACVAVTAFEPGRRFRWEGQFLWLGLGYDHTIEPTDDGTRITFTVDGDGPGVASLGRLFARVYARNLDRAIPELQAQLAMPRTDATTTPTDLDETTAQLPIDNGVRERDRPNHGRALRREVSVRVDDLKGCATGFGARGANLWPLAGPVETHDVRERESPEQPGHWGS